MSEAHLRLEAFVGAGCIELRKDMGFAEFRYMYTIHPEWCKYIIAETISGKVWTIDVSDVRRGSGWDLRVGRYLEFPNLEAAIAAAMMLC